MEESQQTAEAVVRGTVERVTYRNPDNGYSVIQLTVADEEDVLTVVGNCSEAHVGSSLVVRGIYKTHPKYGRQLDARSITPTLPTTNDDLVRYLGSGIVKGIGPKTAQRIVDAFGEQTLMMIQGSPNAVAKVTGVGQAKAQLMFDTFAEKGALDEVRRFLIERDLSDFLVEKIIKRYGTKAIETVSGNPYNLAFEITGIGFTKADQIANAIDSERFCVESPERIRAGLVHVLGKATDEGHSFLPREELGKRARHLLGIGDEIDLEPHLESMLARRDERCDIITEDQYGIYLDRLRTAEMFVADFVSSRCSPFDHPEIPEGIVKICLDKSQKDLGLTFSDEQRQAVYYATQYPLTVITGGPGCGKTTIIRGLAAVFKDAKKNLALAAPTGRASQRMSQVCGMDAKTIHRLLKFDPMRNDFRHGPDNPLTIDGEDIDALIIDEASMMDIELTEKLFLALPEKASVILVGDKDQLPSVGPGQVFSDITSIADLRIVSLTQLYRRGEGSSITDIAHSINAGIVPEIPEPEGGERLDGYFIPRQNGEASLKTIVSLVADQIPRKFGIPREDIAVLTPSNRGPLGTQKLNAEIQNAVNPKEKLAPNDIVVFGDKEYRQGDRICQRKNNYDIHELGVYNGDVGYIDSVNSSDQGVTVELWDGRLVDYSRSDLAQLSHAYALTVHRSQGSEYPCVVLALDKSHFPLLERQLLYTAVTRAKTLLVIVGSKWALNFATKRTSLNRRHSALRARIQDRLR